MTEKEFIELVRAQDKATWPFRVLAHKEALIRARQQGSLGKSKIVAWRGLLVVIWSIRDEHYEKVADEGFETLRFEDGDDVQMEWAVYLWL